MAWTHLETMSITSGTNKWASKAVVVLQLAAWSAVGIVLIEKGVASLQKITPMDLSADNNDNDAPPHKEQHREEKLEVIATTNSATGSVSERNVNLSVIPLDVRMMLDDNGNSHTISTTPIVRNNNSAREANVDNEEESSWNKSISETTKNHHFRVGQWMSEVGRDNDNGRIGGGSAAAIAMIAVGAIMLVLGPAVILLRRLDERRQERRFLKLSGDEEDLPPTYEEATAASSDLDGEQQAPTYSSLNLNSISCPS